MSNTFDPKKYYNERYFKLKDEHRCIRCGDPLTEANKGLMCEFCRKKHNAVLQKHYEKKKRQELIKMLRATWFNANEKLPKPFVSVLVYMPGEYPLSTVREGFVNERGRWYAGGFDRLPDEVVSWREMPEAPEMKGGE